MPRFASVKDGRITIISNHTFDGPKQLPIPSGLDHVANDDLLLHYRVKGDQIVLPSAKKPSQQLKVALVSNYRQRCGISTYAEHLFPELVSHLADYKLFIEHNDCTTGDIYSLGNIPIDHDKVLVCWKRGEPLSQLAKEIKAYDPDIVLINHEWGIFPNARHWLSLLTQLSDYRVITILHSVFPTHLDKLICEAAMSEIIVHQVEAKTALQQVKQIHCPIHIVPHGCYPATDTTKLWDMYRSKHTFIQQGFGFQYKRYQQCIQAVSLLKATYPDIFFTALFSESQAKMVHQLYFDELMKLVKSLGVEDNVAIVRGYQSDLAIDSYLRTNAVAVFPYANEKGHEVFGASGAARLAMSKGIVVITSNMAHFNDLPSIKADTAEDIAKELDRLFADPKAQQDQVDRQLRFIAENNWSIVAKKMLDILGDGVILGA